MIGEMGGKQKERDEEGRFKLGEDLDSFQK
jgi:hypothetical protein